MQKKLKIELPNKLYFIFLYCYYNKKIPIYGTGKNIRDWIHVNDHCNAIFKVLKNGKKGSSYNIAGDNEVDNITIVEKILSIMNKPNDMIEYVKDRPGHDYRYSMNSSKIKKELGWSPEIKFEEGLTSTIQWYINNKNWWRDISEESIVPKWQKQN